MGEANRRRAGKAYRDAEAIDGMKMPPVPSLRHFLGDGARSEGFEEWAADLQRYNEDPRLPDNAKQFLRALNVMTVAAVEYIRRESERADFDPVVAVSFLPRAAGMAVAVGAGQVLADPVKREDLKDLVSILVDEFRTGCNLIKPKDFAEG